MEYGFFFREFCYENECLGLLKIVVNMLFGNLLEI